MDHKFTAYYAAVAADDAFAAELVRVYGARMSRSARYFYQHADAGINAAKVRKLAADDAMLAAMRS